MAIWGEDYFCIVDMNSLFLFLLVYEATLWCVILQLSVIDNNTKMYVYVELYMTDNNNKGYGVDRIQNGRCYNSYSPPSLLARGTCSQKNSWYLLLAMYSMDVASSRL